VVEVEAALGALLVEHGRDFGKLFHAVGMMNRQLLGVLSAFGCDGDGLQDDKGYPAFRHGPVKMQMALDDAPVRSAVSRLHGRHHEAVAKAHATQRPRFHQSVHARLLFIHTPSSPKG
jgi:hypothetical protein